MFLYIDAYCKPLSSMYTVQKNTNRYSFASFPENHCIHGLDIVCNVVYIEALY